MKTRMKICKIQKRVYTLSCLAKLIKSQNYVSSKKSNSGNKTKCKLNTIKLTLIVKIPGGTF